MKIKEKSLIICSFFMVFMLISCKKNEIPVVSTMEITNITESSAMSGGYIADDGGSAILACGVCWSIGAHPTLNDSHTADKATSGSFTSTITDLETTLTYFVRAYATNKNGTAYGKAMTFSIPPSPPVVITTPVTSITETTAMSGGTVYATTGIYLLEGGICWSTKPHPTIKDTYSENHLEGNTFTSKLAGLSGGETYYVVSFVLYNLFGTSNYYITYGNEISFQSSLLAPSVKTSVASSVWINTARAGGDITNDGGTQILARGICVDTLNTPTLNSMVFQTESTQQQFIIDLTGLKENTHYFYRAFATNSVGTGYGEVEEFNTFFGTTTDPDGNIYPIVKIGEKLWFGSNLRTTKFADSTEIRHASNGSEWGEAIPAYGCYSSAVVANDSAYGFLYNGWAVQTHKLCPTGWRVPRSEDFRIIGSYIVNQSELGGSLKERGEVHWINNSYATDSFGFSALPGGYRSYYGNDNHLGDQGWWWTSYFFPQSGNAILIENNSSELFVSEQATYYGLSIRCIKDADE